MQVTRHLQVPVGDVGIDRVDDAVLEDCPARELASLSTHTLASEQNEEAQEAVAPHGFASSIHVQDLLLPSIRKPRKLWLQRTLRVAKGENCRFYRHVAFPFYNRVSCATDDQQTCPRRASGN